MDIKCKESNVVTESNQSKIWNLAPISVLKIPYTPHPKEYLLSEIHPHFYTSKMYNTLSI